MATEDSESKLRIIGIPKKEGYFYVFEKEYAILGRRCGWRCPTCLNDVVICPQKTGLQMFECLYCHNVFKVFVDPDADTFLPLKNEKKEEPEEVKIATPPPTPPQPAPSQPDNKPDVRVNVGVDTPEQPTVVNPSQHADDFESTKETKGMLKWGSILKRKKFILKAGYNVIGREDKKESSDLEFTDMEMSRRSVRINAISKRSGGHEFVLSVLKATNPVQVNGRRIRPGEEDIRLRSGDKIIMGKTTLTFTVKS